MTLKAHPLSQAWNILTDPNDPLPASIGLAAAFRHEDHIAVRIQNGLQATLHYEDSPHPDHPGLLQARYHQPALNRPSFLTILLQRVSILAFLAYFCSLGNPQLVPMETEAWLVAQARNNSQSQSRWLQVNPHVHLFQNNDCFAPTVKLAWNMKNQLWMTHYLTNKPPNPLSKTPWPPPPPQATCSQARTRVELHVFQLNQPDRIWLPWLLAPPRT